VLVLVIAGAALVQRGSAGSSSALLAGRVTSVVDGDTIVVRTTEPGGDSVRVRLIGIDTPEISHDGRPGDCYGRRASEITRDLALDRRVELQPGREAHDRYGRLLAYVRIVGGPDDLERVLLARGAARTLTSPPNDDRAAAYAGLADAARRAGRGLWGACGDG
jgi:micrococcal nuclease